MAAVALAAAALAGCDPYIEGNGVFREEDRTPPTTFQGIHVEDGIEVTVTSGAEQKVTVSGDSNLLEYLETDVVAEPGLGPILRLRIEVPDGSWSSTLPPRAVVQLGELRYVLATGRSHVGASQVATAALAIQASDRSDVLVSGPGGATIDVIASGASVDAGSYPVTDGAEVALSSGARVELRSDGPVTGTVGDGCTLDNLLGTGSCAGVVVPPGDTATIQCNPAP